MLGPLTDEELAAMPAKTKKDPITVALYQEKPFLEAYAAHTDRRIKITGYKSAIGADDTNWDVHGDLQRDFLLAQGLRPEHTLLEVGCGTGRLARKIVPYLGRGNYSGLDISLGAITAAQQLAALEGWCVKHPTFWLGDIPHDGDYAFDFVWAFSVFIHLPQSVMEGVMWRITTHMHFNSRFLFSYVPEKITYRSGVKQFRHTLEDYKRACEQAGLTFEEVPNWIQSTGREPGRWSGNQRVAIARRK